MFLICKQVRLTCGFNKLMMMMMDTQKSQYSKPCCWRSSPQYTNGLGHRSVVATNEFESETWVPSLCGYTAYGFSVIVALGETDRHTIDKSISRLYGAECRRTITASFIVERGKRHMKLMIAKQQHDKRKVIK